MTDDNRTAEFGEYTVIERLGEGGMCQVFRARRAGQKKDCALKLLREERRADEQIVELFLTEADIALLLDHPNLIHTYDAGEVNGRHYIAMELIEGRTLGQMMARSQKMRINIPPDFALYIINEVLEGLHALHTAEGKTGRPLGLVHRDVTPQNVFISYDGRVLLGDFGVAHIQAYGSADKSQTLGKIGYLSPEAVFGEEIDRRSDLFAVGIVLFEVLTRTRLFEKGTDDELMTAIAEVRVPKLRTLEPGLARDLETAIMKSLARKPKDRYETAEEMMYALERFWSRKLGNPPAIAAYMSGLFREETEQWRARTTSAITDARPA